MHTYISDCMYILLVCVFTGAYDCVCVCVCVCKNHRALEESSNLIGRIISSSSETHSKLRHNLCVCHKSCENEFFVISVLLSSRMESYDM